jgi:hypothetical protein
MPEDCHVAKSLETHELNWFEITGADSTANEERRTKNAVRNAKIDLAMNDRSNVFGEVMDLVGNTMNEERRTNRLERSCLQTITELTNRGPLFK